MKPYYDDGHGIVIYHGDCRDLLPHVEPVDLVLTDPPYRGLIGGYKFLNGGVATTINQSMAVGDLWAADFDWLELISATQANQLVLFTTYHAMQEFNLSKIQKWLAHAQSHLLNCDQLSPISLGA